MTNVESFITPVVSTTGEPYSMWLVQFPGLDWRVFSDMGEAIDYRDKMVESLARVSPEED